MACWKWVQIQGKDANTGEDVNEFRCADAWMVTLTIENSQQQRQTAAAVESFRNEMIEGNKLLLETGLLSLPHHRN